MDTYNYLVSLGATDSFAKTLSKNKNILDKLKSSLPELEDRYGDEIYPIAIRYAKQDYAKELFRELEGTRIPGKSILRLYRAWGNDATSMIKSNPYSILDVCSLPFMVVDKVALFKYRINPDAAVRFDAAIMTAIRICEKGAFADNGNESAVKKAESYSGSTCAPEEVVFDCAEALLNQDVDRAVLKARLLSLHLEGIIYLSKRAGGNLIYRMPMKNLEYEAAKLVSKHLNSQISLIDDIYRVIDKAECALDIKLSTEQCDAVVTALTHPFSVITGGPGTGKTSVQKILIEAFEWSMPEVSILLVAPTGQAAKRMSQQTGKPAHTIHDALGIIPSDTTVSNQDNLKDYGLIIIDEASMIDAETFALFMSCVKAESRLVLVGDTDQLPSVGAGSVLRELLLSKYVPVAKLTNVFRQDDGSSIAVNASRIKFGEANMIEDENYLFIERDKDSMVDAIIETYKEEISKYGIDNVICLSAYRKHTSTGVNSLNEMLRTAIKGEEKKDAPFCKNQTTTFYVGDRIAYGRNAHKLVNGEVGYIKKIEKGIPTCVFEGKEVKLTKGDIKYITLAYAQTIHKAQGAEYKSVILVVDKRHKRLLNRPIVFTGITRAKETIKLIGQKSAMTEALKETESYKRVSALSRLIDAYY